MTLTIAYIFLGCGYMAHGGAGLMQESLRHGTWRRMCSRADHCATILIGSSCCAVAALHLIH
ncbi:hypothetical protein [Sphingomonas sp. KR3-1]|uniref:hypothetical protein n=1 Tax=Sphingomonas sp. KR3-1 TaxID=3156611 RepID=UPI0032B6285A